MRFTVLVLMLIATTLSFADDEQAFHNFSGPEIRDLRNFQGYDWMDWSVNKQTAFLEGFQMASFMVIQHLSDEGRLDPQDTRVDEVLLDHMTVEQLRVAVVAYVHKYQSWEEPLWWVIFAARIEAEL